MPTTTLTVLIVGDNNFVAKLAKAPYTPEATTWVKIKNRAYSQALGRADFFESRLGVRRGEVGNASLEPSGS